MPGIPSIDRVSVRFDCTPRDQRIVDRSADDAGFRGFFERHAVLVAGESDERKMLDNVLDKQHRLFAAQAMPAGQPRHRRINFRQTVSGTAIASFRGADKGFEASLVMLVILEENRNQRRGIEERFQSRFPRFCSSRSRLTSSRVC